MKKNLLLIITLWLFQFSYGQVSKTVKVTNPGTLITLLSTDELNSIGNLTLTGNINARDFKTMRDKMPALSVLDLTDVLILSYTGYEGTNESSGSNTYPSSTVPYKAFESKKSLKLINIPKSATSIGNYALSGCTGLTSITIPNNITSIGDYAFIGCTSIETINYDAINCTSSNPFNYLNGIKTVNIGSGVKILPANLCSGFTGLTSITIPNSVTTIGDYAFSGCTGLTSVTIPNNITSIGDYAFSGCTRIETINYNAINCNSLYSGASPFGGLDGVQTINIGDSVKFLSSRLFSGCTRVREINSKAAYPPSLDATTFQGVSRNIPVYPPVATREDYIFDPYWSEFFRIYAKDYVNNVVYLNKQMVSIMTVGSGYILKQPVKSGESVSYLIQPESDFRIASLMVNGKSMLDSLDSNGYLNFSAIKEDINIVITPINTDIQHVVDKSGDNSISCWNADGKLFVVSNQEMAQVELIDLNGRILTQEQNNAFTYVLNQPNKTVNVIRVQLTNGEIKAVKVRLN